MPLSGAVHDVLAIEAIDCLRDEAAIPGLARLFDLPLAATLRLGFAYDTPIGFSQRRIAKERSRLGRRQVDLCRAWPMLAEQALDRDDGLRDARDHRISVRCVVDRGLEHLAQG